MSTVTIHNKKKKALVPKLRFKLFIEEWEKSKLNKFALINPKNSKLPESFIYIDLESVTNGLLIKENVILKNEAPSRAQRILTAKDILYQTVRPYQKNNLYFDKVGNYVASTGYAQIRTKNDSQFLFQFLHTENFVANVMLRCTGTSYPAINSTDLSKIEISHPNLPEQQKIASFLSAIDEKIQQLSRKKELLEQYKKGVMQQLFSGKLRFSSENGEDYPDWEEKKLGDITTLLKDGSHGSHKNVLDGKHYLLSAKNIRNGQINIDVDDRKISEDDFNAIYKNYHLKENDILLTIVGTIGRVAVYRGEKNISFQRSVAFFRFENIFSAYIFQLMNGSTFQKELDNRKVVSAQPGIYLGDLAKITLNIPSYDEQQKIANFLSSIDTKIESVNQQISQTQTFKKGLLQQMFV